MILNGDMSLIATLMVVFSAGLIGGLSPCTLPTAAFVVAYVSGKQDNSKYRSFTLSLFFILGIAFMLSILGVFAGIAGHMLIRANVLNYIIAFILIVMGLWLLKVFDFSGGGSKLDKFNPKKGSGALGAFLIGIPFGISSSPCTLPITASVLAYSATKGSALYGMLLMFTFAIGRSIPLLLVGTFTGLLNNLKTVSKYQELIEKISGAVLILLALYFIWTA
jgi:cytochrome c-type biogenesis protein